MRGRIDGENGKHQNGRIGEKRGEKEDFERGGDADPIFTQSLTVVSLL